VLTHFLESNENIKYVNGPTLAEIPTGRRTINLNNINKENIGFLNEYYQGMDQLSSLYKKEDKFYASFSLFPTNDFNGNDLNQIENYLKENNIKYFVSGDLYIQQ